MTLMNIQYGGSSDNPGTSLTLAAGSISFMLRSYPSCGKNMNEIKEKH
jgi:hypothetical protein